MKNVFALAITSMALPLSVFADKANDNKLEETVTIASRIEVPLRQVATSVSVVVNDDIEQLGSRSILDILRTQPGITAENSGGIGSTSAIRVRGEESYRTLVIIDGMEITDISAPRAQPPAQNLSVSNSIERIEILRGPQGFIYGADAGGVIDISTVLINDGSKGELYLEHGRYDSNVFDTFLAGGNETVDAFASVSKFSSDGLNASARDDSNERDGYNNTTLHGRLGWNMTDKLRTQLVMRDVDANGEYDNCFSATPNDCESEFTQSIGRLSVDYTSDQTEYRFGYTQSNLERNSFAVGTNGFPAEASSEKIDFLGSIATAESSLKLLYGFDNLLESFRQPATTGKRRQLGIFSELQAQAFDALTLSLGVRHDDNDDFGKNNSVRASIAFVQSFAFGNIKYRSSYGTGFRAPSLSEVAYNNRETGVIAAAQETDLQEENSEGFDIGIEYYTNNGAVISLGYFDQEIDNEIIYISAPDFSDGYIQSEGKSDSTGYEASIDYPVNDYWAFNVNYTYNDTETSSGLQRIRRPKNSANIGSQLTLLDSKLRIALHYRIARDAENEIFNVGRVALDDYEVLSITANYALLKNLDITLRGENITDEDYEEVTAFNTAGESFYAGLRFSF